MKTKILATAYEIIVNALRLLPTLQRYFATPSKPICTQELYATDAPQRFSVLGEKRKELKNIDTGEAKKSEEKMKTHSEPMIHGHERKLISMQ